MNRLIKNIATSTLVFVVFLGVISCETDLENIESGVLRNELTASGEVALDITITPIEDLNGVRADNIELGFTREIWLGNYTQNDYSKSIKAGFVSQVNFPETSLVTASVADPENVVFYLDKVVLKIPYVSTPSGAGTDGETIFRLDSILPKNANSTPTKIAVYRNPFFLNTLNPENPENANSFKSNFNYFIEGNKELLSEKDFSFIPSEDDTKYFFERMDRVDNTNIENKFLDSIVLNTRGVDGSLPEATAPFLAIPLQLEKMKQLFWDKFNDQEFSSEIAFQDYFKGIVVAPENEDGLLVPFNLSNGNAQISFIFSIVDDSDLNNIVATYREYNFSLGNIINATYDMTPPQKETSPDNFVIQGTDGSNAEIEILGVNLSKLPENHPFLKYADKDINGNGYLGLDDFKELNDENGNPLLIINDASLEFIVNNTINSDKDIIPQKLHLYKDSNSEKQQIPTNISDAYEASLNFGGNLSLLDDDQTPNSYTFKITDFISDFIDGSNSNTETKLLLKVFNEITDEPVFISNNNSVIRFNVEDYNWNPRSVILYNEKANSPQKAEINIKFTELK